MHLAGGIFFYSAGLILASYVDDHALFRFTPFLLAILAFIFRSKPFSAALLALFLVSLGLNQYYLANRTAPNDNAAIRATNGEQIRLAGTISSINSRPEGAISIDLKSVRIMTPDKIHSLDGSIRIFSDFHNQHLLPGDSVRVVTSLKEARNFQTPGAFNYKRYLLRRNIVATGFTENTTNYARIYVDKRFSLTDSIKQWRQQVRQLINEALPVTIAPHINALAIGDRGALSTEQRKLLADSGLAHLFAVSGLHLGLLASFLYWLLRDIYLRTIGARLNIPARRLLPPLILPILFCYMILTGTGISTLRALVMLMAVALLCAISRRTRPADILFAAMFLILVLDPLAIFEPSFQLSAAGAGGIILSLHLWQDYVQKKSLLLKVPMTLLCVTLAATTATLPIILLHFHMIAPAGLLLNLFGVPLVSLVILPLTLIGVGCTLVNTNFAVLFFKLSAGVLERFLNLVDRIVSIDFLSAQPVYLSPVVLAIVGSSILLMFIWRQIPRKRGRIAIAVLCVLALSNQLFATDVGRLNIIAIDVGQGESTLLQTPDGGNYLVDGGGLYSKRFDTGERLVAPTLGHIGVRELDAVILSHDHPDHRKGLVYIMKTFRIKAFWSPVPFEKLHFSIKSVLTGRNIPVRTFSGGWNKVGPSGNLKLYVPRNRSTHLNNHSLVLYARYVNDGVLLPGDLEAEGIAELTEAEEPGPVTLIKLPHHGSRKSDPTPLLEKFHPQYAYASVGFDNRYGLPHSTVLSALENKSIPLKRTDLHGTIRLSTRGDNWVITHWKKGVFR